MKPERWEQIKTVYHSALEREPGKRDAFLDQAERVPQISKTLWRWLLGNWAQYSLYTVGSLPQAALPPRNFQPTTGGSISEGELSVVLSGFHIRDRPALRHPLTRETVSNSLVSFLQELLTYLHYTPSACSSLVIATAMTC